MTWEPSDGEAGRITRYAQLEVYRLPARLANAEAAALLERAMREPYVHDLASLRVHLREFDHAIGDLQRCREVADTGRFEPRTPREAVPPDFELFLSLGKAACARAQLRAAEGRHGEAAEDLLAVWLLGTTFERSAVQSIEFVMGNALRYLALRHLAALLELDGIPADVPRAIAARIPSVPRQGGAVSVLRHEARMTFNQMAEDNPDQAEAIESLAKNVILALDAEAGRPRHERRRSEFSIHAASIKRVRDATGVELTPPGPLELLETNADAWESVIVTAARRATGAGDAAGDAFALDPFTGEPLVIDEGPGATRVLSRGPDGSVDPGGRLFAPGSEGDKGDLFLDLPIRAAGGTKPAE
jgi:hypothetical protein